MDHNASGGNAVPWTFILQSLACHRQIPHAFWILNPCFSTTSTACRLSRSHPATQHAPTVFVYHCDRAHVVNRKHAAAPNTNAASGNTYRPILN